MALGLARYYTDKPCKSGHVCERYTCNSTCILCARDSVKKWLEREGNREYHNDYQSSYGSRRRKARIVRQATPSWHDESAVDRLKSEATRLSKSLRMDFSVEYIIPLKHKKVCGLHVVENMHVVSRSHRELMGRKFNPTKLKN